MARHYDKIYHVWRAMKQRCQNKNNKSYPNYGGRGIQVCKRWLDYANFITDMGSRPLGYSLDRINNDGNYTPKNCRWASKKQQDNNRRATIKIRHNGKVYSMKELAQELKINYWVLKHNYRKRGKTIDEIIRIKHEVEVE